MSTVNLTLDGPLAILEINRPQALNALNAAVLDDLEAALEALPAEARLLAITGAGDKAFVAGADIKAMADMSVEVATAFSQRGQSVFAAIEALPIPVVAAVNGFALGGGCELALACDIIYAAENAQFGQPEVGLGVIPGFGGCVRLSRYVGLQRARELIFTGRRVKADEALAIGLAARVMPRETLIPACKELAESVAKGGPLAVAAAKAVMLDGIGRTYHAAAAIEADAFGALFDTADQREGMAAFGERRPPSFTGQ
jgi:enoyl-CoA hydratase